MNKPYWLKIKPKIVYGEKLNRYKNLRKRIKDLKLHTVCESAHCPNMAECFGEGVATFMILGDVCTRGCKFCNIKTGNPNRKIDDKEPVLVASAIKGMGLSYVVITSVDRDDLPDGGASHFAGCIESIRATCKKIYIEVLIPDFSGRKDLLDIIINANPDVIAHNIETVERLSPEVRDLRASYKQSLEVLKTVKENGLGIYTKSGIMVGLGEQVDEVIQSMKDLREYKVDFLTIGQYLQPSKTQLPVKEYIVPDQFKYYEAKAKELGFLTVYSGPFVRSSYKAGKFFKGYKKLGAI